MRRATVLSALLLTAALLCAMPGLVRQALDQNQSRMDNSLRPTRSRTMTVWLLSGDVDDGKLLSQLFSDFEKEEKGLRVFVRKAEAEELYAPDAVLPDAALFSLGDVLTPDACFAPLAPPQEVATDRLSAGFSGGSLYAVPLWLSPNVMSLPEKLAAEALPWRELLTGGLWVEPGVALQQVLSLCPSPDALISSVLATPEQAQAKAWPLSSHQSAVKAGQHLTAAPLAPAASHRARLLALCKDTEDGKKLLGFLLGQKAQQAALSFALVPVLTDVEAADPLLQALVEQFSHGFLLPNAFAHSKQELLSLCRDGFSRLQDPVETLLRLR